MSAPRKIWAYDDGLNSPDSRSWSATVPIGAAYHHDDVVLELVAALEEIKSLPRGEAGFCRPIADAALAKIAQEG